MKTRSIISIIVVIAMALTMAACGTASALGNDTSEITDNSQDSNTNGNDNGDANTNGNGSTNGNSNTNNNNTNGNSSTNGNGNTNTDGNTNGSSNTNTDGNTNGSSNTDGNGNTNGNGGTNGNSNTNTDGNTNGSGNTDGNTNGSGNTDTDGNTNTDSNTNGNGSESGNNSGSHNQSNLAGSAEDILNQLIDAINNAGISMPMALPPLAVTGDLSQNAIGLSETDFDRLVASAYYSQAAIGTFAHQIIMIQAKDAASAAEIKNLVSGPNGYDATKWVCVMPQSAVAIDSGEYVMIVASRNEVVNAALEAFEAAAGTTGNAIQFFEGIDDGSGSEFGGMALMPPADDD